MAKEEEAAIEDEAEEETEEDAAVEEQDAEEQKANGVGERGRAKWEHGVVWIRGKRQAVGRRREEGECCVDE